MGAHVRLAQDGLAGIDMFHMFSPDMVLLQDLIPLKHGFEVCREIKRTAKGPTTPVVLLATLTNGKRCKILDTGCDAYLEKPVLEQDLIDLVRKYLPGVGSVEYATSRTDHRAPSEWEQIPFDVSEQEIGQKLDELISWDQAGEENASAGEPGRTRSKKARPGKSRTTKKKVARKAPKKKVAGSTARKKTASKSKSKSKSKSGTAVKPTGNSPRSKKQSPPKGLKRQGRKHTLQSSGP
jgi:CheY-like chemotaxis protein